MVLVDSEDTWGPWGTGGGGRLTLNLLNTDARRSRAPAEVPSARDATDYRYSLRTTHEFTQVFIEPMVVHHPHRSCRRRNAMYMFYLECSFNKSAVYSSQKHIHCILSNNLFFLGGNIFAYSADFS